MREQSDCDRRDCRIVVFYRVDPERVKTVLPTGWELRIRNGCGMGGIALKRQAVIRSALLPRQLMSNTAVVHFLSAVRTRRQRLQSGSMVLRYDTSSRVSAWLGRSWHWQRRHHHARFRIMETSGCFHIDCDSDDSKMHVSLSAQPQRDLSQRSVFGSKGQILQMLQNDLSCLHLLRRKRRRAVGLSPTCRAQLIPLHIRNLESSLFDGSQHFPVAAAEFDSAYWVRDEEVVWSEQGSVCCDMAPA